MLTLRVGQIDALEAAVCEVEARLGETLAPFRAVVERLITMPGFSDTVARRDKAKLAKPDRPAS